MTTKRLQDLVDRTMEGNMEPQDYYNRMMSFQIQDHDQRRKQLDQQQIALDDQLDHGYLTYAEYLVAVNQLRGV